MDLGRHRGSTVVVTGAGSGVGRAVTLRLLGEGAVVVALDVNEEGLAETGALAGRLSAVEPLASLHLLLVADVADSSSVDATMSQVSASHPRIDALVNVAGVMDGHLPVHEVDDRTWERVMSVNAGGTMRMLRVVIPQMLAAGAGAIVNVASLSGLRGGLGGCAYTASKHAVIGLTRAVAWTYADRGVRCNAVCPGVVRTPLDATRRTTFGQERAAMVGALRIGSADPDDIASLISWLSCAESQHVNGAIVTADAGWSSA
ncbi:MAG TPA: SDR family oxidoreductase [Streptosporangiaceae bacterium]|nr:SDR family oxidoreductase [Streptosporangiaceae bacterium]